MIEPVHVSVHELSATRGAGASKTASPLGLQSWWRAGAGVPLDLFGACTRPPEGADEEDGRDLVTSWVGGLLGLAGRDPDPVKSRDFVFLAACVDALWTAGRTATLETLLETASAPPFAKVGALSLDALFPPRNRQALVLARNALLASPAPAAFRQGEPLDVARMLAPATNGKARLSIVSIAHLGDAERLFVVATLLARVKAWMRALPGSPALRALVYVDEIFGFFPPTAEPPTKKPLLTLLKQARAFGVGVVLASQNPVDLDYRGLANCGCWWVGTLQTERDRARLSEGLVEAGGQDASKLLDRARKRVFLLHDIHRKEPALVETRWAMSYLRGPMTKQDLAKLRGPSAPPAKAPDAAPAGAAPPPLPPEWPGRWVDRRGADLASAALYVRYAVRFRTAKGMSPEAKGVKLFPLDASAASDVLEGEPLDAAAESLLEKAPRALRYPDLPAWVGPAGVKAAERAVRSRLPDKLATTLLVDPVTGALSLPGEAPADFARRAATGAEPPAALRDRLEKKKRDLAAAESVEQGRSMETLATGAAAAWDVFGGIFLGKKKTLRVGKVGSVLTKKRMENAAEAKVSGLQAEIADLEAKLAPPDASRFEKLEVVPSAASVDILSIGIAWLC